VWGKHHKAMNSLVTSATGLRAYRRAIVARFAFRRGTSRKAVWDFFRQRRPTSDMARSNARWLQPCGQSWYAEASPVAGKAGKSARGRPCGKLRNGWRRSAWSDTRRAFNDNDIDVEVLRYLTDADLEKSGVSLGHRRKFWLRLPSWAAAQRHQRSLPAN
jgi:hypothetical protein